MAHHSDGKLTPNPHNPIQQAVDAVQGQAIAQMVGGFAVGQIIVYLSQQPTETATATATPAVRLGENPYQGLRAFLETDGDRFFGRETQIEDLWQKFQHLHDDRATVRILPIYGPSGSGKSSLARAGLIPELGKRLLPGRDRVRVVVLTPGTHPLEALATVLARIATQDPTPVAKMREFQEELLPPNPPHQFDGLRRIAGVFPDINSSPLIVLVDQFEEIYTLCTNVKERDAFIENLLCAASDPSQQVSVILTMRSDFLGATQQHPHLNKLFSSPGFLVPIMQAEELVIAITEPAKRAGYELDKATVQLLLEESQGQDGTLPLLQFALTQIWEGLRQGVEPAETLKQIGGVGGALESEAKRLYDALTSEQQRIARSIFLAVIQLNDDNKSTRRRASISELITSDRDASLVREVIDHFSRPGVWILVTSCNEQQVEMVEVAHEALIRKWKELQEWLKEHGQALRQKRKIEQATQDWKEKNKSKDYLLQGRSLRDAKEFIRDQKDRSETSLSNLAVEFVKASQKKQRKDCTQKILSIFIAPSLLLTPLIFHFGVLSIASKVLYQDPDDCKSNSTTNFFLWYKINFGGQRELSDLKLCNEYLSGIDFSKKISIISNSNFSEADFDGSNLSKLTLDRINLSNTKNLNLTNFERTLLKYSCFNSTDFGDAILADSIFVGGSFQKTSFKGTNIKGAIFIDADLSTTDLDLSQISSIKICRTKIPQKNRDMSQRNCNDQKVKKYQIYVNTNFKPPCLGKD